MSQGNWPVVFWLPTSHLEESPSRKDPILLMVTGGFQKNPKFALRSITMLPNTKHPEH